MRFAKLDWSFGCWLCTKIVYDIDMRPFTKSCCRKLFLSEAVDNIERYTIRVLSYRKIPLKPPLKVPFDKKDEEGTWGARRTHLKHNLPDKNIVTFCRRYQDMLPRSTCIR